MLAAGCTIAVLIEREHRVRVYRVGASATGRKFRAGGALVKSLAVGIGLRNRVEGGMQFLLVGAGAAATVVTATRFC